MKTRFFTLLLLLSCCQWLAAQCPTGDITFSTQGQIDSFQINYPGCTHVLGDIHIKESIDGNITHLNGMSQIDSISGKLLVQLNQSLTSLSGLNNLAFVSGNLWVQYNPSLTSLNGLDNVTSVGGLFVIFNAALTSLSGLDDLISVGNIFVGHNAALTNLSGMDNLVSVSSLSVYENPNLISLSGLDSLISISSLSVTNNFHLTSLSGLDNIDPTTITQIHIDDNPNLSICNILPICDYLQNGGVATIVNSAPGCSSVPEVIAACQASPTEEYANWGNKAIQVSPNPATNFINLQFLSPFHEPFQVSLFDSQGKLFSQQATMDGQAIDVNHLPNGIYLLKATNGDQVFTTKFIKQ